MKKFLLTLAALAITAPMAMATDYTFSSGAVSGSADPYTYTFTATPEVEGFTFTAKKNKGNNAPTVNKTAGDVRMYAQNTFTIAAPEGMTITKIVFNISKQGKAQQSEITVDEGTVAEQTQGGATIEWSGNATGMTFTVGTNNTYGTNTSKSQGQFDFDSFVVTAESALKPGQEPAEIQFEETSYTIPNGEAFTAPQLLNPNKLTATYSSSNTDVATVDAATGEVTIAGAGTTTISATTEETEVFAAGKASYTLTVIATVNDLSTVNTFAKGTEFIVNCPLTVVYVNGQYCYVIDNEGNSNLVYNQSGVQGLKEGDIIPGGWTGTMDYYSGLPEITYTELPAVTETNEVTPKTVTVAELAQLPINTVAIINDVVFAENTPATKANFTGTCDGETINFRNNFMIAALGEDNVGKPVAVKVAVSYYEYNLNEMGTNAEKRQYFPISYEVLNAVDVITVENDAAEYYDLNGRRVAAENAVNGLYIVRQNGKAMKVFVK